MVGPQTDIPLLERRLHAIQEQRMHYNTQAQQLHLALRQLQASSAQQADDHHQYLQQQQQLHHLSSQNQTMDFQPRPARQNGGSDGVATMLGSREQPPSPGVPCLHLLLTLLLS